MTFEPLIHVSPFMLILQILMWGALTALFFATVSYLVFYLPWHSRKTFNKQDGKNFILILTGMGCFFGLLFGGIGSHSATIHKNEDIVRLNVAQKYQVQDVTFAPRARGLPSYSPEQPEPQPVMVKSNGKTRPATLTNDREISEPTLLDFDSGEPIEDLLRK